MKYYISEEKVFLFNRLVPEGTVFSAPDETPAGKKWVEVNPDGSPLPVKARRSNVRAVSGEVRGSDVTTEDVASGEAGLPE